MCLAGRLWCGSTSAKGMGGALRLGNGLPGCVYRSEPSKRSHSHLFAPRPIPAISTQLCLMENCSLVLWLPDTFGQWEALVEVPGLEEGRSQGIFSLFSGLDGTLAVLDLLHNFSSL